MMTETEFNDRVDDTLLQIEEALDEAESDLDYNNAGGVLTIVCENGAHIIFTRQGPVSQLWVATPDGGFHFDFDADNETWVRDSDQLALGEFLAAAFAQHAGESLVFF